MDSINLPDLLQIVAILVNALLLMVVWRQLVLNSEQIKISHRKQKISEEMYLADHDRRKKQSTIEYVNNVRDRYVPIMDYFDERFGVGHVINISDISEADARKISELLSVVEHMAVGVETEVYDIDIIDRMSGAYFLRMRRVLDPYIARSQQKNPRAFIEFDHMCDRIRSKRKIPNEAGKLAFPSERLHTSATG